MPTPPRSVLAARRRLHTQATGEWKHGTVTIAGTAYAASVSMDEEGMGFDVAGGVEENQLLVAHIAKADMGTRPNRGDQVLCNDRAFEIESVGGDNPHDQHWTIRGRRTPGGDA